ncbi:MAG: hypothetical protein HC767_01345 [Akkermansiaceae bacterium]|nr:hypothetical protein [Akkermansiaceae bacterium]
MVFDSGRREFRDNSTFFAYGPARPAKSLIVAPISEAADYLALAAAPPGFENQSTERIDPVAFSANNIDLAVILWAAPLPTGQAADHLNRFLIAGGHVIFSRLILLLKIHFST